MLGCRRQLSLADRLRVAVEMSTQRGHGVGVGHVVEEIIEQSDRRKKPVTSRPGTASFAAEKYRAKGVS